MLEFLSESLGLPYKKIRNDFGSDKLYQALDEPTSYWEKQAKKTLPYNWEKTFEETKVSIIQEIPGMHDLIEKLKSQDIQVVLLSNTKFHRARFIEKHGGYDQFDPILLSCHLGVKKPDPKIYKILLRSLGVEAKDCVFIDNKKSNVTAGNAIGIDSIVFESLDQLKADLRLRDLSL